MQKIPEKQTPVPIPQHYLAAAAAAKANASKTLSTKPAAQQGSPSPNGTQSSLTGTPTPAAVDGAPSKESTPATAGPTAGSPPPKSTPPSRVSQTPIPIPPRYLTAAKVSSQSPLPSPTQSSPESQQPQVKVEHQVLTVAQLAPKFELEEIMDVPADVEGLVERLTLNLRRVSQKIHDAGCSRDPPALSSSSISEEP